MIYQIIRIDGENDEITAQSFQNHNEAYDTLEIFMKSSGSAALMPTTMIDDIMK